MEYELLIQNGNSAYMPAVSDGMSWTTELSGTAGKLVFDVYKDEKLKIARGNPVRLKVGNKGVFFGFIFSMNESKEKTIQITAYDQLRYLKNKDTYVFSNKRADEIIRIIARDFNLQIGSLANTKYKIPSRVEDNQTLFDMINHAMALTTENTGTQYVFFDNFGKLSMKKIQDLAINYLLDPSTAEDFQYSASIDDETYNQVKLTRENEKSGKRDVYMARDSKNIAKWGVLQHFDTLQEKENGKNKANSLLKLYNREKKKLSVSDAFGDLRIRAGSMIVVNMQLNDKRISNMMLVTQCTHKFEKDKHSMDLTLQGGEFSG